jgi:hypothetical protein
MHRPTGEAMKVRSRAGGPIKGRRRKAAKPIRRNKPKAPALSTSSHREKEPDVARLSRELCEALERQTATSEVLRVISSSPGDLEAVFRTMLENATRICEAKFGTLDLSEGGGLRLAAAHDVPPAFTQHRGEEPFQPAPGGILDTARRPGARFTSMTLPQQTLMHSVMP